MLPPTRDEAPKTSLTLPATLRNAAGLGSIYFSQIPLFFVIHRQKLTPPIASFSLTAPENLGEMRGKKVK